MSEMTRDEAIEVLKRIDKCFYLGGELFNTQKEEAVNMAIDALKVDVVHCEECKHYNEWQNGTGNCQRSDNSYFWFGVDFNDYCSFGERRED